MQIKYSYAGVPTLEDFSNDDSFIRGILGPFGSGKSSACVIEIVNRALAQVPGPDGVRRSRFAVIRNTHVELRDTTIRTVMQWLPAHHFGKYVEHKHSYTVTAFPNCEFEILFMALDRPDDLKKLLSLELTGAWVNEAREIPWGIIEGLQGRVGRYPAKKDGGASWFGIWMDTNPPDSDSKWYKFFEETEHPKGFAAIFRQPDGLSPQAENVPNLPANYYRNLATGKALEWIKVYVRGQYGFVADGKFVYPEYNDQVHCRDVDPMPGITIIRGWDFGLTPACSFSQMLPDGRWLVFDEMVSENMSIDEFSDDVIQHCNRAFRGQVQFEDIADPAGEQRAQTDKRTCFEIMQAKGIMVEGGIQDPKMRQEAVRKTLRTLVTGEPQFILHSRCKVLRKGFMGGYRRRRLQIPGVERYSESPDKNMYSHIHDSLQYPMAQYFAPAMTTTPNNDDDFYQREDYAAHASRSEFTGY